MAHFAQLDSDNGVINVVVVNNVQLHDGDLNEQEELGINFLVDLYGSGKWVQTSFNGNFRKNYAAVGYSYDSDRDAFIPPKPHESWTLDFDTCLWQAPIPQPGGIVLWNDETQAWDSAY